VINPKTILGEWVTALQALPNLIQALGDGGSSRIQFYSENATIFGAPAENNLRLAILSMPPASVMVAWQGTRPGRLGTLLTFVHEFSIYLRAPEHGDVGYEDLFDALVNGLPSGSSLKMLHTNIDPHCEPMDFHLPAAQRNVMVVSSDGATFEYFEIRTSLIESGNPGGE
jgi:hypothetical protein